MLRRCFAWALTLGCVVAATGAPQLRADNVCPPVEGQFTGVNAIFRTGQELPREGVFSFALQPTKTVAYLSGSRRVKGDGGGFGGELVLRTVAAGRYRLFLSGAADIELIQNYASLSLTECRGEQASYVVSVEEGKVILQVRGAPGPLLDIAFLRI